MTSDAYTIILLPQAEKDLKRLRGLASRALAAIRRLAAEPYAGHTLAGSLKGARSLEFSMPGGAYRAVYVVDEAAYECIVLVVGAHEGIYARAERRMRAIDRRRRL